MTTAELIQELADELEAYIRHHYEPVIDYPVVQQKFDRDMEIVREARKWLEQASLGNPPA